MRSVPEIRPRAGVPGAAATGVRRREGHDPNPIFDVRAANPLNTKLQVFPVLLQLACDGEKVAKQLFEPLMFQLVAWFSKQQTARDAFST